MVFTMKKENNLFYVALFFGMTVGLFGSTSIVWANEKNPEEIVVEDTLVEDNMTLNEETSEENNTDVIQNGDKKNFESDKQDEQEDSDPNQTDNEEDAVLNDEDKNDLTNEDDIINNDEESLPIETEDDLNNEESLIENTVVNFGWNEDKTQYYQNGQLCHGLVNIDGVNYYFDENTGTLLKGIVDLSSGSNEQK